MFRIAAGKCQLMGYPIRYPHQKGVRNPQLTGQCCLIRKASGLIRWIDRAKDGNHVGIQTHCHVPGPGTCHGSSTKRVSGCPWYCLQARQDDAAK